MAPRRTEGLNIGKILGNKLVLSECQNTLLRNVCESEALLKSKILSSVQPKIGKVFKHKDLETKKHQILIDARLTLLSKCSIPENLRETNQCQFRIKKLLQNNKDREWIEEAIKVSQNQFRDSTKKRLDKKLSFHLDKVSPTDPKKSTRKEEKRKERTEAQWKIRRARNKGYNARKKLRKQEKLSERVKEIKETSVRNLSSVVIPDVAYLYLARGLKFVRAAKINKEELEFDAKQFLRKLEWKVHHHRSEEVREANANVETGTDIHFDMRIPSRAHAPDLNEPLLEEIKTKVLGFVSNFAPEKPPENLTPAELRGKAWLTQQVKAQKLFVTRADKGGATLVLDFATAVGAMRKELDNPKKFSKGCSKAQEKIQATQKNIKALVLEEENLGHISKEDRLIITGMTDKGGMKHSPVFRAVTPYPYPLFKLHKLTEDQIATKTVPPLRLVHSTKQGPMYRLEKWCSPYLTNISRDYCREEFLLDTPQLLRDVEQQNRVWPRGDKSLLFTLDVVALYPSIPVDLALEAMDAALSKDSAVSAHTKTAVRRFSEFILKSSFVVFQDEIYELREGIPTGNCISRQVADIALQWLLFDKLSLKSWKEWDSIRFWRRFIDDILGRWRGTERLFEKFVKELNRQTEPFGIKFGDSQIGSEVNYLDVTLSIDDEGQMQYKLFRKETDARQYLNPSSFHPKNVFESVAFSQMMRVIQRNSLDATCLDDLEQLKSDLVKCGHNEERLEELEPKAVLRNMQNSADKVKGKEEKKKSNKKPLVLKTKFFHEVSKLKAVIGGVKDDIAHLIGDTQVVVALKKHQSIERTVVKNRSLGGRDGGTNKGKRESQACGAGGCKTCPLMFKRSDRVSVNGKDVLLDPALSCNDRNIIYLAQCTLCAQDKVAQGKVLCEDSYIGQTTTAARVRFNGHRSKFKTRDLGEDEEDTLYMESALSQHCHDKHPNNMSLSVFKVGLVKSCKAVDLDMEESRFISLFRTGTIGLNRIKVIK